MDLIMLTHTLDNRSTEIIYYDYPSYRETVWCDAQGCSTADAPSRSR